MKTLYISDLNGTLLNSDTEISPYTQNILNQLIAEGLFFSVATARTAATAVKITENINFNIPISLMNGACMYDISKKEYIYMLRNSVRCQSNVC